MSRFALLVVEDDPTQRGLLSMMLEQLDADLVVCSSVDEAFEALHSRDFDLVITDLLLHDRSGHELVEGMAPGGGSGRLPKVIVCSADLKESDRRRLKAAGVWQMLRKPLAMAELKGWIVSASEGRLADAARHEPPIQGQAQPDEAAARLRAGIIRECRPQFRVDILTGDAALRAGDAPRLRRLGHDLKSVLRLLGMQTAASHAESLEGAAEGGMHAMAASHWEAVRHCLCLLCDALEQDDACP